MVIDTVKHFLVRMRKKIKPDIEDKEPPSVITEEASLVEPSSYPKIFLPTVLIASIFRNNVFCNLIPLQNTCVNTWIVMNTRIES